ncbi:MAG: helix-turn-helix domain-containing protein [Anaerolineae bacterium]|nr:helix-turn-helix domain-containing protein [Anaerolineae bacterium]
MIRTIERLKQMKNDMKFAKLREIHQKKLGIQLKHAREQAGKTSNQCADILFLDHKSYLAIENGEYPISLPQLELLAFSLNQPIEQFFSDQIDGAGNDFGDETKYYQALNLRTKTIAAKIKLRRLEKGLSPEELATKIGQDTESILKLESGEASIPLPVLEQIVYVLDLRMKDFYAQKGKLGRWNKSQEMQNILKSIPDEVQQFIKNPSNEPYLRLAMHLSSMSAEKLRAIAEGILEITF